MGGDDDLKRKGSPIHAVKHAPVLGLWGFAAVAYFTVAGGPFGIESAVIHAGAAPVFLGFLIIPFIWSLPQALITAELSTLLPDNGGYVLWVTHAFGDFAAWMVGLNGTIGSILDLALYPVLFSEIVADFWFDRSLNRWAVYALRVAIIGVGLLINVRGVKNVSIISAGISISVVIPFLISFFAQLPAVFSNVEAVHQTASVIDWTAFLSTLLWSYTGWDTLGCIAGEVKDPAVTYVKGTSITLVFVTLTYMLPLFISITTHPDYWTWHQGNFAKFTGDVAPWLGRLSTVVALACQLGIFTTGLSTSSRAVWALAGGSHITLAPSNSSFLSGLRREGSVAHLPKWLAKEWAATGTPVMSLLTHCAIILILCLLPFDTLVQADVMLVCMRLAFEVASLVMLRFKAPKEYRPTTVFCIPGGWLGCCCVLLPKIGMIAFVMMAADPLVWVIVVAINVFGMLVFGLRVIYDKKRAGHWWPRGYCNLSFQEEQTEELASDTRVPWQDEGGETVVEELADTAAPQGASRHRRAR